MCWMSWRHSFLYYPYCLSICKKVGNHPCGIKFAISDHMILYHISHFYVAKAIKYSNNMDYTVIKRSCRLTSKFAVFKCLNVVSGSSFVPFTFAGEDEREEQTGASAVGNHKGICSSA